MCFLPWAASPGVIKEFRPGNRSFCSATRCSRRMGATGIWEGALTLYQNSYLMNVKHLHSVNAEGFNDLIPMDTFLK